MPFPVELKYIEEAESALNVKFPNSFKEKMMEENGGEVYYDGGAFQLIPFFDKSSKKRIKRTCNHIVLETNSIREMEFFQPKGVAIGEDGTGDLLVLMQFKGDVLDESIFLWYHESGRLQKIANDIIHLMEFK